MEQGYVSGSDQVYVYINDLKKFRKGFITNFFNYEKIEFDIKHNKTFFEYEKGSYLNLLCEDDGFFRLYFYIIDLDKYQFQGIGKDVVCDVFVIYEDEIFGRLVDKLYSNDFVQYACIEQWSCLSSDNFPMIDSIQYVFDQEKRYEIVSMLFDIFDKYTDYLPRKCEIDMFMKDKKFINAYEAKDHKYIGSLIYTEKKRMATIEFYFVSKEQRGKRLSYLFHDYLYQLLQKKGYKFVSYINKNNLVSIAVHQKYGYQKNKLKKYIFVNEKTSF